MDVSLLATLDLRSWPRLAVVRCGKSRSPRNFDEARTAEHHCGFLARHWRQAELAEDAASCFADRAVAHHEPLVRPRPAPGPRPRARPTRLRRCPAAGRPPPGAPPPRVTAPPRSRTAHSGHPVLKADSPRPGCSSPAARWRHRSPRTVTGPALRDRVVVDQLDGCAGISRRCAWAASGCGYHHDRYRPFAGRLTH